MNSSKNLSDFQIRPLDYATAMKIVVEKHYLHRKAPCSFAYGLFLCDDILGVITYGTPSSAPLRRGICGDEEKFNVIELTRLWVDDSVPKNGESYLIGRTLKLIDKDIVVSFADASQGHIGVVYQATNWIYTGLSAKRTDWTVTTCTKHGQTWADKYTRDQMDELFGHDFYLKERPRKHRYVYFRNRKEELLGKLRYPVRPYPKRG